MAVRDKQGTISIIVALLALAVMCIGFFSIELWFAQLAMCELKNCSDAASMGAAASLVSAKDPEPLPDGRPGPINDAYKRKTRETAKEAALKIMLQSSVIGHPLENARIVADASQVTDLQPGGSAVSVRFVDAHGKESVSGKHIQIDTATAVAPMSGHLLGLSSYIVRARGTSAAAKLDLAFCLDDSLSMATDTPISMVYRGWNGTTAIQHLPFYNGLARKGKTIGVPEPTYLGSTTGEESTFDGNARGPAGDVGTPPGPGANATITPPATTATNFTDRVINLDGKPTFEGGQYEGLAFPDVATLVEASRGNLDSKGAFESSLANTVVPKGITPNPHYKEVYERWALKQVEPFNSAKFEVKRFFDLLEANTDSHFSLVPFSQRAAKSEDDKMLDWPVSIKYPVRKKIDFDFQKVGFRHENSQYDAVKATIDTYKLHGGTAIPYAIDEAVASFESHSRPDARRAILLFTDGEPTSQNGSDAAVEESIAAAKKAAPKGITIFAIGFMHGSGKPSSRALACLKGVAEAGAPGGHWAMVNDVESLHEVFRLISRQLVTLE